MEKIKIFLSSRVDTQINFGKKYKLENLRDFIQKEIEKERLLGKQSFEIVMHDENNFDGYFSNNWYQKCIDAMRACHLIVILYSGEAGYSQKNKATNGICHKEFLIAIEEFGKLSFGINISQFCKPQVTDKLGERKNKAFSDNINYSGRFLHHLSASSKKEFEEQVIDIIKSQMRLRLFDSIETQKIQSKGSNLFKSTLDWSKLNYAERINELKQLLEDAIKDETKLDSIIKQYHAVPDNMSVADARNRIKRPFLEEHDEVKNNTLKRGVLHFVAVYGSVSEIQAKNLVGYPDLTVIKAPFGLYLWDKIRHIQMFFFHKCINSEKIGTRITELNNWLSESQELANILNRAKARYLINKVILEQQKISNVILKSD